MPQLDRETKYLIDEIVRELRDVRFHRNDFPSFEKACLFKSRLAWFRTEMANLPNQSHIQTFLGALEEEINKLFERIKPAAHRELEDNVIRLYPDRNGAHAEASAGVDSSSEFIPDHMEPAPAAAFEMGSHGTRNTSSGPVAAAAEAPEPNRAGHSAVDMQPAGQSALSPLGLIRDYLSLLATGTAVIEPEKLKYAAAELDRIFRSLHARE